MVLDVPTVREMMSSEDSTDCWTSLNVSFLGSFKLFWRTGWPLGLVTLTRNAGAVGESIAFDRRDVRVLDLCARKIDNVSESGRESRRYKVKSVAQVC